MFSLTPAEDPLKRLAPLRRRAPSPADETINRGGKYYHSETPEPELAGENLVAAINGPASGVAVDLSTDECTLLAGVCRLAPAL